MEKRDASELWGRMQTGAATTEFPQKIKQYGSHQKKMELHFDPAIPLLGINPKNPKTPIPKHQNNLCSPMFKAVLFIRSKCWTQSK